MPVVGNRENAIDNNFPEGIINLNGLGMLGRRLASVNTGAFRFFRGTLSVPTLLSSRFQPDSFGAIPQARPARPPPPMIQLPVLSPRDGTATTLQKYANKGNEK